MKCFWRNKVYYHCRINRNFFSCWIWVTHLGWNYQIPMHIFLHGIIRENCVKSISITTLDWFMIYNLRGCRKQILASLLHIFFLFTSLDTHMQSCCYKNRNEFQVFESLMWIIWNNWIRQNYEIHLVWKTAGIFSC